MSNDQTHIIAWRRVLREPALVIWGLYIFLIPFYIFKSGLPQPGDLSLLLLAPIALRRWNGRLTRNGRDAFGPLVWFSTWVCIVDYAWAIWLGNFGVFGADTFLLFPLYYVYNALIFLVALVLFRRYGDLFLRVTIFMVIATIYMQAAASFVLRSSAYRGALFFNNPNQLGYYALLAGTLIAITHRRLRLRLLTSSMALTGCGYLALVSASRAAVGGIAILLVVLVFSNPRVIAAACVVAIALVGLGGPVSDAIESSEDRVLNRQTSQGFLEERGYDRVLEHKEYLLFGAGEGGFDRFDDGLHTRMELHSTPGTILFCYGAIGASIFLMFIWRVVRGANLRAGLMLVPPMLYTVAHQGLRFTMFWVLIAVFVALKDAPPLLRKIVAHVQ